MENKFLKILSAYQDKIDKELNLFFEDEIKEAKAPFLIETLKTLKEYSLRPGKRIRAILINYGYFLAGGKDKKVILKTSIFIELIHNFLLIHDDILDQDGMRRGKLSLHRLYQKNAAVKNRKEKEYYGVSMSIVAGDMMEFLGRKILSQSKFSDKHKVRAIEKLNQILISTAHGEMFEYWLRKNKTKKIAKEKDVFEIYKNKTAYYTFVGPLQIGALLAGSSDKSLFLFEKIGLPLGIAFQIKDDIEDAKSDIKEEQPNLLSFKNIDECKELAKNLTNQAKKEILITNFPIKEKQFLLDLADYIRDK